MGQLVDPAIAGAAVNTANNSDATEMIDHPLHYNAHPSGVEVIDVIEQMHCSNLASAFKYIARYALKRDSAEDLGKAAWYVKREGERRRALFDYSNPRSFEAVRYAPEYVPFYNYIGGEADQEVRKFLIRLWNVDKSDDDDTQYKELDMIEAWLNNFAGLVKRHVAGLAAVEKNRALEKEQFNCTPSETFNVEEFVAGPWRRDSDGWYFKDPGTGLFHFLYNLGKDKSGAYLFEEPRNRTQFRFTPKKKIEFKQFTGGFEQ